MERRPGVLGGRAAVVLTTAVGVLSILTGLANIGTGVPFGPLATVIPPELRQAAAFTGTVTGFGLLVGALGLRRQVHVAWYAVILAFPVTALQGLVQASLLSIPLVALSLFSIPTLYLNRRHFDKPFVLSPAQTAATVAVVGAQLYGTVGAFALQEHFGGVETITDAFYFTLVTASTVGYGDITPHTQTGRWFAMTVVVLGTTSFAAALGAVLGPAIERRFARTLGRMSEQRYDLFEDHIIVLGHGGLTEPILEELGDQSLVVVTPDADRAAALRERGHDVLTGDPTDEDVLDRVGVQTARAVVAATDDDAEDAFAIMTASQLGGDALIVAAATDRNNVKKLKRAGADTVISPQVIGAHLLAQSALGTAGIEAVAEKLVDMDHPSDVSDGGSS